jgi:hypothetical protein
MWPHSNGSFVSFVTCHKDTVGRGVGAGKKTFVTGSWIYNARKHFLHVSEILTSIRKKYLENFSLIQA